jgi:hypothetical protein
MPAGWACYLFIFVKINFIKGMVANSAKELITPPYQEHIMKKHFIALALLSLFGKATLAQTVTAEEDSRFRFGLRITPQPTWFTSSTDKNISNNQIKFGFGFGLNMEYRLTKVAALLTGIGGDFESGKFKYRYEPGVYAVYYELNESSEFVKPVNGIGLPIAALKKTGNTGYLVKDRQINTTYVTIPLILKLSTNETNGLRYFGMFGGELGFRSKAVATDTYYESYTYSRDSSLTLGPGGSQAKLNLGGFSGDARAGILRAGLNLGMGIEYRLTGSTAFFVNVNYFRAFTGLMRKDSQFLVFKTENSGGTYINKMVQQNLLYNAVRINLGFMF